MEPFEAETPLFEDNIHVQRTPALHSYGHLHITTTPFNCQLGIFHLAPNPPISVYGLIIIIICCRGKLRSVT